MLTAPVLAGFPSSVAKAVHSLAMSVSTRPPRQMAAVRGRMTVRVYQLSEAVTPRGGGGGGGGG